MRCVYILFQGYEVLYVGATKQIETRIKQHRDKPYDKYVVIKARNYQRLEMDLIRFLRPKLNKYYNHGPNLLGIMKTHVKNYFQAFGYDESSFVACEICGRQSSDIHHIEPRSKFGSKNYGDMDKPNNLVALCRKCHMDAHGPASRDIKIQLKEIVAKRQMVIK